MSTDQNHRDTTLSAIRSVDRRTLLVGATAIAGLAAAPNLMAKPVVPAERSAFIGPGTFPNDFLWGASTAAHQVEGGNVASDYWLLEHTKPSLFREPSGDACDHYHHFRDDIRLLADLGLNTYRFSVEWARIEPEQGFFSNAALDHYRKVLEACREHKVTPVVTLHHFTSPRWFAALGGWENDEAPDLLARYAEKVALRLGDLIGWAVTVNEPNVPEAFPWKGVVDHEAIARPSFAAAAVKTGSSRFSAFPFGNTLTMQRNLIAGHRKALAALKAGPGSYPVGPALAITDDRPDGRDTAGRDRKRAELYEPWFAALSGCDFIGVQTYTGMAVGRDRDIPLSAGTELTQMGYAFAPEALGATVRYAHERTGLPVLITENGVATTDDTRRIAFIKIALESVLACLADGIDVRGYLHWSLFDNFEWDHGYKPRFGLVEVDLETFERRPKPSAYRLGAIARANRLA